MNTWEKAWQENRTGWDKGEPVPALIDYLAQHTPDATQGQTPRALVPGCGSGYDAFALAQHGYTTTGLDIAPTAAERFDRCRAHHGVSSDKAHIVTDNFFSFTPDAPFDLIWDYTFLCAIQPSQRELWGQTMTRLLHPNGTLLVLVFPIFEPDNPSPTTDEDKGPPYRMHLEHVRHILEPHMVLTHSEEPSRQHPDRKGLELLTAWKHRNA